MSDPVQLVTQDKNVNIDFYTGVGTNAPITFTIKEEDGTVIDISAWTIDFVIKATLDAATDIIAPVEGTFVTDGTDGKVNFNFDTVTVSAAATNAFITISRVVTAGVTEYTLKQYIVQVVLHGQSDST